MLRRGHASDQPDSSLLPGRNVAERDDSCRCSRHCLSLERKLMALKKGVDVKPASGKLGILLPGMGAVATTFIAGVLAVRRNLAKPIGSLTQMGTIRLGKRTDTRSPRIKDFVPLAELDDLVFGGWDLF